MEAGPIAWTALRRAFIRLPPGSPHTTFLEPRGTPRWYDVGNFAARSREVSIPTILVIEDNLADIEILRFALDAQGRQRPLRRLN